MQKIKTLITVSILLYSSFAMSQDVDKIFESRIFAGVGHSLSKKTTVEFTPEFRMDENFSPTLLFIAAKVSHKLTDPISLKAAYRLYRDLSNDSSKFRSRYEGGVNVKKQFGKLTPSLYTRYLKFSDDSSDDDWFRYQLSFDYQIDNSNITPKIGSEVFHSIDSNTIARLRYFIETKYDLPNNNNNLTFVYLLDLFTDEFKHKNSISIGYNISL